MKATTFAAVLTAFLSLVNSLADANSFAEGGQDKPNVLVIITDEHNFRTLGCYRDRLPKEQAEMWGPNCVVPTPHMDRIADEGVICTRAYATAPVCSPSRAAMITGLYPHNTGVPTNNHKLRTDIPTLATILNDNGYRSSFIGKWHLGGESKPGWAPKIDGGFQHTKYMFNRGHWKKLAEKEGVPSVGALDKKGKPAYGVSGADEETFTTDFLTDRVIQYINQPSDKPFLTVVSYPDPHGPNTVRAPYDRMYDSLRFLAPRTYGRKDFPIPKWLGAAKHPKFVGAQMSKYFGMVKCIDDNIGRLLATLEESGELDSTIILLTSDHGDLCYEHDRLNKGNPYEGSARVPMLVRYPKRLAAKTLYVDPVGTVDVSPTILGLAGIGKPVEFEGRDLTSSFRGETKTSEPEITFLRNSGTSAGWLAAVDRRYKLVVSVNDRPWLFDAEQDPDELLNFYGRPGTAEATSRLAQALLSKCEQTGDPHLANDKIATSLKQCVKAE